MVAAAGAAVSVRLRLRLLWLLTKDTAGNDDSTADAVGISRRDDSIMTVSVLFFVILSSVVVVVPRPLFVVRWLRRLAQSPWSEVQVSRCLFFGFVMIQVGGLF